MKTYVLGFAAVCFCLSSGVGVSQEIRVGEQPKLPVVGKTSDVEFMQKATVGGNKEMALSKLAEVQSEDPKVKEYARDMIKDHTKLNGEVGKLADKMQVKLPTTLDADTLAAMNRLKGLKGAAFDREYVPIMVADHMKTLAMFKEQAMTTKNEDLAKAVKEAIPVIDEHLKHAKMLPGAAAAQPLTPPVIK